ncbi:MAG: hypothetical protein MJY97_01190 [Bacteroidales bacterium]|nr:hypothetical protein [Bacteroidales bacterium]
MLIFKRLKRMFQEVAEGKMAYEPFIVHFKSKYLVVSMQDDKDTIAWIKELSYILEHEAFIRATLTDPSITMHEFMNRWYAFDPSSLHTKSDNRLNESAKRKYLTEDRRDINTQVIYQYLLDRVWETHPDSHKPTLPIETVEYAIYNADFRCLMQNAIECKFKDYPLIVICHLKECFAKEWYTDVCQRIKIKKEKVSGWHRTTKAKKFDSAFPRAILK